MSERGIIGSDPKKLFLVVIDIRTHGEVIARSHVEVKKLRKMKMTVELIG